MDRKSIGMQLICCGKTTNLKIFTFQSGLFTQTQTQLKINAAQPIFHYLLIIDKILSLKIDNTIDTLGRCAGYPFNVIIAIPPVESIINHHNNNNKFIEIYL